jgi:hypothetical protein
MATATVAVAQVNAATIAPLMVAVSASNPYVTTLLPTSGKPYAPQNKVGTNGKNNGQSWAIIGALLGAGPTTQGTIKAILTAYSGHHCFVGYRMGRSLQAGNPKATAATASQLAKALTKQGVLTLPNVKVAA